MRLNMKNRLTNVYETLLKYCQVKVGDINSETGINRILHDRFLYKNYCQLMTEELDPKTRELFYEIADNTKTKFNELDYSSETEVARVGKILAFPLILGFLNKSLTAKICTVIPADRDEGVKVFLFRHTDAEGKERFLTTKVRGTLSEKPIMSTWMFAGHDMHKLLDVDIQSEFLSIFTEAVCTDIDTMVVDHLIADDLTTTHPVDNFQEVKTLMVELNQRLRKECFDNDSLMLINPINVKPFEGMIDYLHGSLMNSRVSDGASCGMIHLADGTTVWAYVTCVIPVDHIIMLSSPPTEPSYASLVYAPRVIAFPKVDKDGELSCSHMDVVKTIRPSCAVIKLKSNKKTEV